MASYCNVDVEQWIKSYEICQKRSRNQVGWFRLYPFHLTRIFYSFLRCVVTNWFNFPFWKSVTPPSSLLIAKDETTLLLKVEQLRIWRGKLQIINFHSIATVDTSSILIPINDSASTLAGKKLCNIFFFNRCHLSGCHGKRPNWTVTPQTLTLLPIHPNASRPTMGQNCFRFPPHPYTQRSPMYHLGGYYKSPTRLLPMLSHICHPWNTQHSAHWPCNIFWLIQQFV